MTFSYLHVLVKKKQLKLHSFKWSSGSGGGQDRMKPRLDIAIHFQLLFGKKGEKMGGAFVIFALDFTSFTLWIFK